MIIRANGKEIAVKAVVSEQMKRGAQTYPALRFEFEGGVTATAIAALCSGSFDIVDDNGNVAGTHDGYTTKGSLSLVVGKVTDADQRVAELEAEIASLQEAVNIIVGGEAE